MWEISFNNYYAIKIYAEMALQNIVNTYTEINKNKQHNFFLMAPQNCVNILKLTKLSNTKFQLLCTNTFSLKNRNIWE